MCAAGSRGSLCLRMPVELGTWQQELRNSAEFQVLAKDIQSQAVAEHRNLPGKKMKIFLDLFS